MGDLKKLEEVASLVSVIPKLHRPIRAWHVAYCDMWHFVIGSVPVFVATESLADRLIDALYK
jgi:hypothetical protein